MQGLGLRVQGLGFRVFLGSRLHQHAVLFEERRAAAENVRYLGVSVYGVFHEFYRRKKNYSLSPKPIKPCTLNLKPLNSQTINP